MRADGRAVPALLSSLTGVHLPSNSPVSAGAFLSLQENYLEPQLGKRFSRDSALKLIVFRFFFFFFNFL